MRTTSQAIASVMEALRDKMNSDAFLVRCDGSIQVLKIVDLGIVNGVLSVDFAPTGLSPRCANDEIRYMTKDGYLLSTVPITEFYDGPEECDACANKKLECHAASEDRRELDAWRNGEHPERCAVCGCLLLHSDPKGLDAEGVVCLDCYDEKYEEDA